MGIIDPIVPQTYFTAHSGFGVVGNGSYTNIRPQNQKRRWFYAFVPANSTAEPCRIVLPRVADLSDYGEILLYPGQTVVLSMSGDMPWQGAIYAAGLAAASYLYWAECEDFP
jgi:hypothetical protein